MRGGRKYLIKKELKVFRKNYHKGLVLGGYLIKKELKGYRYGAVGALLVFLVSN